MPSASVSPLAPVAPAPLAAALPGVAEAGRPADVERARSSYAQRVGPLSVADARRAQQLIDEALHELGPPRVVVNRSVEQALDILGKGRRFPTAFDGYPPDVDTPSEREGWDQYMERRKAHEQRFGIHGEGDLAGKTVYGTLQLSDRVHPIDDAAQPPRLNTGEFHYGEVAFVLKPEAARRATLLPNDSFYALARPAAIEDAGKVVLERVLRNFRIVREQAGESTPWPDVPAWQLRQRFRQMLNLPDAAAVQAMKQHLKSDAFTHYYIEAQVRGVQPGDIEQIRLEKDPALAPEWRKDPHRGSIASAHEGALQALAGAHNIAFSAHEPQQHVAPIPQPRPLTDVLPGESNANEGPAAPTLI